MERRRHAPSDLEVGSPVSGTTRQRKQGLTWPYVLFLGLCFVGCLLVVWWQKSPRVEPVIPKGQEPAELAVPTTHAPVLARESDLVRDILADEASLRSMKTRHKVLETDAEALALIKRLQETCRELVNQRYPTPFVQAHLTLLFPEAMRTSPDEEMIRTLHVELAPLNLMPYAVYKFLEIARNWEGGSFHRNAGHVLQAQVKAKLSSLAFQEYHPDYPHVKYTLGFAGRPGGPPFYISTVDNTDNHGPGSQGSKTEADSCFGSVRDPESREVVHWMQAQPGTEEPHGFIENPDLWILILNISLTLS